MWDSSAYKIGLQTTMKLLIIIGNYMQIDPIDDVKESMDMHIHDSSKTILYTENICTQRLQTI